MLHALLHRKLDELTLEPQRLEDALTSTVFGTLVLTGAWNLLARWLGAPTVSATAPVECWFWPRLAFAEPDVVLRLGVTLVVVEAKFRSGRHDLSADDVPEEELRDQFRRQHDCFTTGYDRRIRYAEALERAIGECLGTPDGIRVPNQLFVVDARRERRARREWEKSRSLLPPGASLRLVTWQALFRLLGERDTRSNRWATDLRAYLSRLGLDTFESIGSTVAHAGIIQPMIAWRKRHDESGRLVAAMSVNQPMIRLLRRWRLTPHTGLRLLRTASIDARFVNGAATRAILSWRAARVG